MAHCLSTHISRANTSLKVWNYHRLKERFMSHKSAKQHISVKLNLGLLEKSNVYSWKACL